MRTDDLVTLDLDPEVHAILELYEHEFYDNEHREELRSRITLATGEQKEVAQDFIRSFVLKARPGTGIDLTSSNGVVAQGVITDGFELRVPLLFQPGAEGGTYEILGDRLGCRIESVKIYAVPAGLLE